MMDRRWCPSAMPFAASVHTPWSSGPRSRSVSAMAPARAAIASAGTTLLLCMNPAKPHMRAPLLACFAAGASARKCVIPDKVLDFAAAVQAVLDTRAAGGHPEYRGLFPVAVFDNNEPPVPLQRLHEIARCFYQLVPGKIAAVENICGNYQIHFAARPLLQ